MTLAEILEEWSLLSTHTELHPDTDTENSTNPREALAGTVSDLPATAPAIPSGELLPGRARQSCHRAFLSENALLCATACSGAY